MPSEQYPFADIGNRLRWHRLLLGMDQGDYASKAGIKQSTFGNWETGYSRISLDGARALRKTYGLSLDFIIEGIPEALPTNLFMAWTDNPAKK
jgi:transcriptional regulator with XRE-family HTH domain